MCLLCHHLKHNILQAIVTLGWKTCPIKEINGKILMAAPAVPNCGSAAYI